MLDTRPLDLPYRRCVGIMLINRAGRVWVGSRRPKWAGDAIGRIWQMPQGGIMDGETEWAAALRELEEETSVTSAELLSEASRWFTYDLPEELVGVALKGRYRGQRQKWFAMRFTGTDREIDISARGRKAEFDDWRWVDAVELPDLVVPFKRQIYCDVVREFAPYAASSNWASPG
jgi:putative (di)nucleoside polyphosphate hydrolase